MKLVDNVKELLDKMIENKIRIGKELYKYILKNQMNYSEGKNIPSRKRPVFCSKSKKMQKLRKTE